MYCVPLRSSLQGGSIVNRESPAFSRANAWCDSQKVCKTCNPLLAAADLILRLTRWEVLRLVGALLLLELPSHTAAAYAWVSHWVRIFVSYFRFLGLLTEIVALDWSFLDLFANMPFCSFPVRCEKCFSKVLRWARHVPAYYLTFVVRRVCFVMQHKCLLYYIHVGIHVRNNRQICWYLRGLEHGIFKNIVRLVQPV